MFPSRISCEALALLAAAVSAEGYRAAGERGVPLGEDGWREMLCRRGRTWRRVSIPLTAFPDLRDERGKLSPPYVDARVRAYAARSGMTAPPGLVYEIRGRPGQYATLDGMHRLIAALLRGDRSYDAYLPVK